MRERTALLCLLVLIVAADWMSEAFLPHGLGRRPAAAAACFVARRHTWSSSRSSSLVPNNLHRPMTIVRRMSSSSSSSEKSGESSSSSNNNKNNPTTFREAEVLGLKLMQEGEYEQALKTFQNGLKLPGSRSDVVRTKRLSGPSPVGGSTGGYESQNIQTLDEFELQAANYNMACALAQLNRPAEAVDALRKALENGFDNYATVRSDPDLESLQGLSEFESLMEEYEPKRGGFNPFGLFGKK